MIGAAGFPLHARDDAAERGAKDHDFPHEEKLARSRRRDGDGPRVPGWKMPPCEQEAVAEVEVDGKSRPRDAVATGADRAAAFMGNDRPECVTHPASGFCSKPPVEILEVEEEPLVHEPDFFDAGARHVE